MANSVETNTEQAQPNHHSVATWSDSALLHNAGLSTEWTPEEQLVLEDGLSKYTSDSAINCYAKIAMQLPSKTIRDVALRCKWMTIREQIRRRKYDNNSPSKTKDHKEKINDPSADSPQLAGRTDFPSFPQMSTTNENANGSLYGVPTTIGGATGQLQQNAQTLQQISANLETHKLSENISLFCQARDNLIQLLNSLNGMPE